MTISPYSDQELRVFAGRVIMSKIDDVDFVGVAEQFEDEWETLGAEQHDTVHRLVFDLVHSAAVRVTWP
jgi:hypothetical protein